MPAKIDLTNQIFHRLKVKKEAPISLKHKWSQRNLSNESRKMAGIYWTQRGTNLSWRVFQDGRCRKSKNRPYAEW